MRTLTWIMLSSIVLSQPQWGGQTQQPQRTQQQPQQPLQGQFGTQQGFGQQPTQGFGQQPQLGAQGTQRGSSCSQAAIQQFLSSPTADPRQCEVLCPGLCGTSTNNAMGSSPSPLVPPISPPMPSGIPPSSPPGTPGSPPPGTPGSPPPGTQTSPFLQPPGSPTPHSSSVKIGATIFLTVLAAVVFI